MKCSNTVVHDGDYVRGQLIDMGAEVAQKAGVCMCSASALTVAGVPVATVCMVVKEVLGIWSLASFVAEDVVLRTTDQLSNDAYASMSLRSESAASPSFAPPSETTFSASTDVTLSCATTGTTIHYTTDGSTPTCSSGTVYTTPIHLTNTTTIKAIACLGGASSNVVSASYTNSAGTQYTVLYMRQSDNSLWLMAQPSGQRSQVPLPAGCRVIGPRWSHDGQRITFYGGYGSSSDGIYVVRSDGTSLSLVPNTTGGVEPDFSPDGNWICYSLVYGPIYKIHPDGSGKTQLVTQGSFPRWSPDGAKILYTNWGMTYSSDLFVCDLAAGSSSTVAVHPAGYGITCAQWTSHQPAIVAQVVDHNHADQVDLWTMNADGSSFKNITGDWASSNEYSPSLTPDGQYIVFGSTHAGGQGIWRMRVDGSERTSLNTDAEFQDSPMCSW